MIAVEIYKNGGPEYKVRKGDGRPDIGRNGTYAEYVAVRADEIARKPASIDHKAASGVALAGLTAWQGLFRHGQLQPEQRVLIHGAAGGVGIFGRYRSRVRYAGRKGAGGFDQSVKATRSTREHGGHPAPGGIEGEGYPRGCFHGAECSGGPAADRRSDRPRCAGPGGIADLSVERGGGSTAAARRSRNF